ncbi:hypothetical protein [Oleiharenicola lentus]|uniref:hypothetical protein n=1 Tax=Oleiharenicola lentus TaxID=2508720 RepID=UPI003F681BC8
MLQLSFSLQEKLFNMPPSEFLQKEVSEQVASLKAGESVAAGREKCLTYASLLKETAALYENRGHDDFATGARQLALHVTLSVALENPSDVVADKLVGDLLAKLDPLQLHPPVRELLEQFNQS